MVLYSFNSQIVR